MWNLFLSVEKFLSINPPSTEFMVYDEENSVARNPVVNAAKRPRDNVEGNWIEISSKKSSVKKITSDSGIST